MTSSQYIHLETPEDHTGKLIGDCSPSTLVLQMIVYVLAKYNCST